MVRLDVASRDAGMVAEPDHKSRSAHPTRPMPGVDRLLLGLEPLEVAVVDSSRPLAVRVVVRPAEL